MSQEHEPCDQSEPAAVLKRINQIADRFDAACKAALEGNGPVPQIDAFVAEAAEADLNALRRELELIEREYRAQPPGQAVGPHGVVTTPLGSGEGGGAKDEAQRPGPAQVLNAAATKVRRIRCPHCQSPIQLVDDRSDEVLCPSCGSSFRLRDTRLTSTVAQMRQIGKFQLLERVGLGAMGAVWKARDTVLDKIVALKIPREDLLDSASDRERFHREARAAAQLRHPGIVPVHEVAELETEGRKLPALVSEFIDGVTLRELLDTRRLTFREAAELVAQVADALDHAHARGVVHRDLKPANIMLEYPAGLGLGAPLDADSTVGDRPGGPVRPRAVITDFGLALRQEAEAVMTIEGQTLGTPVYMSPEQHAGKSHEADARSDVWSLGVILYELLTGELPFRGSSVAIAHQIQYDEPRPPRRVNDKLPRDLETISLKCLAKSPARRYATARALSDDLCRWLRGEPIQARPVGQLEKLWLWSCRNPRVAALTATVLLLVTSIAIGSTVGMFVISEKQRQALAARKAEAKQRVEVERQKQLVEDERDLALKAKLEAEAQEAKAKQLEADTQAFSDFLVDDVLAVARPEGVQGGLGVDVTVARALEAAEANLEERFTGRPLAEATARDAIGKTWRNLAKFEQAERHLRRAVELREQELGTDDPATLDSRNSLGVLLDEMGRFAEAIALEEETLEKWKAKLRPDDPRTLRSMGNLATTYLAAGKLDRALPLLEETLEKRKAKLGPENSDTLDSMNTLANAYVHAGKLDMALPLYEETLEKRKTKLGPEHPHTLASMNNLANAYDAVGKLDKALPLHEQTLEKRKAKLGLDHPETLQSMHNLASAYMAAGNLDKALPLLQQTLETLKAKLGPDHPNTLFSMSSLASAYCGAGKLDQGLPLLEETLEKQKTKFGSDHADTLRSMSRLASAYYGAGKLDQALPLLEETLEKQKTKLGSDHPDTLRNMNSLGTLYFVAGKTDQALALFEQSLEEQKAKVGPDHPDTLHSMNNLALGFHAAGRLDEAEPLFRDAATGARRALGIAHPFTQTALHNLADCYAKLRQPEKAEPLLRELAAFWREKAGADSTEYARELASLGLNMLGQQKLADAELLLRECLMIREKKLPDDWVFFNTKSLLGGALAGQKKFQEAEPLLVDGYSGMKEREAKIPPAAKPRLAEAIRRLVDLYTAWDKPEEAAKWQAVLEESAEKPKE